MIGFLIGLVVGGTVIYLFRPQIDKVLKRSTDSSIVP